MKMYHKIHYEINYNANSYTILQENHILELLKSLKHSLQLGIAQRMKLYHAVNALKLRRFPYLLF